MRFRSITIAALAVAGVGLTAACGDPPPEQQDPPPPPPSDNPIDVAIWPRLVANHLTELPPAPTDELCRRVALDLVGVAPDADETAANCTGKTAEQIVRTYLADPRFVAVERRYWIRRIGADPTAMMADHIADADHILDAAATGAIGYDDMVARLLAHPVMTINRPIAAGDDVAPTVQIIFKLFLGRAASVDEVADYANLLRPWRRRFEDRYDKGYGYYVAPAALVPDACHDPVTGAAACTSTVLGAPTTMDPTVTPLVPAGYSQTSSSLFYYEMVEGDVPAELEAELEKPGRLLATRAELWDEIADATLARLLGWWRSTAAEPDTVLPEVRRAVSEWFRAQSPHDLRELYVIVMTSLLYTTSADTTDVTRPPWATGPTKVVEPEQLLDTLARVLDRPLGLCDAHTDEPVGRNFYWPDRLRTPQPADFYGFGYDFFRTRAQQLGGCIGAVAAPKQPGLPALFTHIDIADELCTLGGASALLPDGVDPADTSAATADAVTLRLFTRFLSRAPTDDERAALTAAGAACAGDTSCANAGGLARETCGALLRSTAFLTY